MKRILSIIVSGTLVFSMLSTFETFAAEPNHSAWEKFLKYDLCIDDYDSLSEDEQQLCHFIFDTEQAANDNIICERARRTLAGDKNIGDRITTEQLDSAYGIWDKYSAERIYGWQSYIHCVPDVIRFGGESDSSQWINEYWLDDIGSTYVIFNERTSPYYRASFDVFDKNGTLLQTIPAAMSETEYKGYDFRGDEEYMEKSGFIEKNGGYYYIKPDGTAVFEWCIFSEQTPAFPIPEESDAEPIKEPFIVESEINGCPVTAIEHAAFINAPLTEIILPDNIEYIDYTAFYNCSYLESINLPEGLKYLGSCAFMKCTALESITVNCPEIKLEENTFNSCDNLTSIDINVREIDERSLPYYVEEIRLGEDIEKIDYHSFSSCKSLNSIEIPTGVKNICQGAFIYSNIRSVTIPPTVQLIGAYPRKTGEIFMLDMNMPPLRPLTDRPVCAFDSDCVIYGYKGTEAERYAKEWNLDFVELEAVKGDVNFDEKFNVADVVTLQKWLADNTGTKLVYWKAADLSDDDNLDIWDLVLMKRKLLNETYIS